MPELQAPVGFSVQKQEEPATLREQLHWTALGLGCVWFVNDAIFLQVPYWIGSQPQGLKLPNWIALTGSVVSPAVTIGALLLRRFKGDRLQQATVPALIALSIASCVLLGSGLWRISSWFIYLATACAVSVGTLVPLATVPWIQASGYKTSLISALYLGGSVGSLFGGVLAIVQSPGDKKRFSPEVFFIIVGLLASASVCAYVRIRRQGIGVKQQFVDVATRTERSPSRTQETRESLLGLPVSRRPEAGCACLARLVPEQYDAYLLQNWRQWIGSAWPMACWTGVVGMCTWSTARSMMGFAATHTVVGHHACRSLPVSNRSDFTNGLSGCALFCAQYGDPTMSPLNRTGCASQAACTIVTIAANSDDLTPHATCTENRGEYWVGWITALAQFAFAAGILGT